MSTNETPHRSECVLEVFVLEFVIFWWCKIYFFAFTIFHWIWLIIFFFLSPDTST